MSNIVAICLGGCEKEVLVDLQSQLPTSIILSALDTPKFADNATKFQQATIFRGESGCGKLLLQNVSSFDFLESVRSVQYWIAHAMHCSDMTQGDDYAIDLERLTANIDFDAVFNVWKAALSMEGLAKHHDVVNNVRKPKFCVRCIRDGKHQFTSVDFARKLGEIVINKTGWDVDLCAMDFEVVSFLLNECLVVGIHIPTRHSVPFLKSKLPSEIRHPAVLSTLAPSLRPSTSYTLIQLARPGPSDVMVDCMCGSGSGFVEAAYSHHCALAMGGDVNTNLQGTLTECLSLTRSMSGGKAVAEVRQLFLSC